jgi:hypothetical protein
MSVKISAFAYPITPTIPQMENILYMYVKGYDVVNNIRRLYKFACICMHIYIYIYMCIYIYTYTYIYIYIFIDIYIYIDMDTYLYVLTYMCSLPIEKHY